MNKFVKEPLKLGELVKVIDGTEEGHFVHGRELIGRRGRVVRVPAIDVGEYKVEGIEGTFPLYNLERVTDMRKLWFPLGIGSAIVIGLVLLISWAVR